MIKNKLFLLTTIIVSSSLTACNLPFGDGNTTTTVNDNDEVNKENTTGSDITYVGFYSTSCPHCQEAMPSLEEFYTQNTNSVNMEINVLDKGTFTTLQNLPQNNTNPKSYTDYTNEECGYVPSYVVLDKDKNVIEKKCGGSMNKEQLETLFNVKSNNLINNTNEQMTNKEQVSNGDIISVDYIGRFTDGTIFDTSIKESAEESGKYDENRNYVPLEFTVGQGQMIPCFDKGVVGMKLNETKKITCEPKEAYGECDEANVQKVNKSDLKDFEDNGFKLEKGTELPTQYGMLKIVDTDETTVSLDTNHHMCGKVLEFEVTIKSIK